MREFFQEILKSIFVLILIGGAFQAFATVDNGTLPTANHSALLCMDDTCATTTQINFVTTKGRAVRITDDGIIGDVWSTTMGWIKLDPDNAGVRNTSEGVLSGYAWGENSGWVNFDPTNGGVTIDREGKFAGWAWAQNYGWIKFDCSVTNACIETDWRHHSDRGGSSGSYSPSAWKKINNPDPIVIIPTYPIVITPPSDLSVVPPAPPKSEDVPPTIRTDIDEDTPKEGPEDQDEQKEPEERRETQVLNLPTILEIFTSTINDSKVVVSATLEYMADAFGNTFDIVVTTNQAVSKSVFDFVNSTYNKVNLVMMEKTGDIVVIARFTVKQEVTKIRESYNNKRTTVKEKVAEIGEIVGDQKKDILSRVMEILDLIFNIYRDMGISLSERPLLFRQVSLIPIQIWSISFLSFHF